MGESEHVLYISHNGLAEPLGRRQVLPYLVGLSARGWRITVLSFEKAPSNTAAATASAEEVARIVAAAGINWRPLCYHHRPPLLSTAVDVLHGWWTGRQLGRGVDLIHARSTVPALMAKMISQGLGVPWVFDLRGLLAEEYVDAGHWRARGLRQGITSRSEKSLLRSADGVVALTRAVFERRSDLRALRANRPTAVIPCSVDLGVFRPSENWRHEVRAELGWGDEPVLIYSGSLGSWYRITEMLDFFEAARGEIERLRFLLLTPQVALAEREVRSRGLSGEVVARSLAPDAVPRHLAAGDAGICFLGRHASKDASSPTKYGEYLAAGLPVVTNGWIGDAHDFAAEPAWLLVNAFTTAAYRRAGIALAGLLKEPVTTRQAARELACREFALETAVDRYHSLYMEVLRR